MDACCSSGESDSPVIPIVSAVPTWTRRALSFAEWALPVTALALVPKCPACLAGYVLLFTGVGVSFAVAAVMRWTVIGMCIAVIALLLLKLLARLVRSRRIA